MIAHQKPEIRFAVTRNLAAPTRNRYSDHQYAYPDRYWYAANFTAAIPPCIHPQYSHAPICACCFKYLAPHLALLLPKIHPIASKNPFPGHPGIAAAASVGLEYSVLGLLAAGKSTGTADTPVREIVKAIYRGTACARDFNFCQRCVTPGRRRGISAPVAPSTQLV